MSKADKIEKGIMTFAKVGTIGAVVLYFLGKHKKETTSGIGAARGQKKFYVYAGYYENLISSKPLPAPYILRRTFRSIDAAIDYAESFGDHVTYCDNVKYDLPDYLYDALQENNEFAHIDGCKGMGKIKPDREEQTRVIFRKYPDGDIIALFPDIIANRLGDIMCYEHYGQHGAADYKSVIDATEPASENEYNALMHELQQIGYDDLVVAKRQ